MSTLLVMAGGTGGHVYPALAVADLLRGQGIEVVWLGTRAGLEARAVPAAGFDVEWVNVRGLRGKGLLRWAVAPLQLLIAVVQAMRVIYRRRPDALLGMGGFVAGPGGVAAWLLRRPLLIHEANAIAGLTNRVLARLADCVMTGFPGVLESAKRVEWVGNPVRAEIAELPPPDERIAGRTGAVRLLVVGGSQGARVLNERLPMALAELDGTVPLHVRHQCGRGNSAALRERYAAVTASVEVEEFIDDMATAYAWADLVVSRSGAMTIAEITAAGLAAILVPYPYAVNDHQSANAAYLADRGAAVLVREEHLGAGKLAELLDGFARDRARLLDVARRARALAKPDATMRVAAICREALHA